jgi:hypothetical protein
MAAGRWNNEHFFSIRLLFRQTFAIWLFVVNFMFGFSIGSSYGQTFFNAATAPSRQRWLLLLTTYFADRKSQT